jgi:hypothetical protein
VHGYALAPYGNAELARLSSLGITSTEDDRLCSLGRQTEGLVPAVLLPIAWPLPC